MLQINLPQIHKGISKDKDNPLNPSNYVKVRDGVAVVNSGFYVFAMDLKSYFTESALISDEELKDFNELMEFMEGKSFSSEFWNEIANNLLIRVLDEETLFIENDKISKNIFYQGKDIMSNGVFSTLISIGKTMPLASQSIAVDPKVLNTFLSCFGKLIQSNSVVFEITEKKDILRITVDNFKYIYGFVANNVMAAEKPFKFDSYKEFCNGQTN